MLLMQHQVGEGNDGASHEGDIARRSVSKEVGGLRLCVMYKPTY